MAEKQKTCATCAKSGAQASNGIKHCAKCKAVFYCSRECQRADWKLHKKDCARLVGGDANAPAQEPSMEQAFAAMGLEMPKTMAGSDFSKIGRDDWLHGFSERKVFKYLIDAYRMRVEDEYVFTGDVDMRSLYGGVIAVPLSHFRRFLKKAEKRQGLLPPWWNLDKREDCEFQSFSGKFSNIKYAVEKSDIQEHYQDNLMPLKLRSLGEKIYGYGFGGYGGSGRRDSSSDESSDTDMEDDSESDSWVDSDDSDDLSEDENGEKPKKETYSRSGADSEGTFSEESYSEESEDSDDSSDNEDSNKVREETNSR